VPGPAADLAILHVVLRRTAARVQSDHDFLTAVRTSYLSFGVEHDIVYQGIRADLTASSSPSLSLNMVDYFTIR